MARQAFGENKDDIDSMSVKQLKDALKTFGVTSFSGMIEKQDFRNSLRRFLAFSEKSALQVAVEVAAAPVVPSSVPSLRCPTVEELVGENWDGPKSSKGHLFQYDMIKMGTRVCRIRASGWTGTGFLIQGKDVHKNIKNMCIMTNFHVIDSDSAAEGGTATFFEWGIQEVRQVRIDLKRRLVWSEKLDYCIVEIDPNSWRIDFENGKWSASGSRESLDKHHHKLLSSCEPARLSQELPKVGQTLITSGHTGGDGSGNKPATSDSAVHFVKVTNVKSDKLGNGPFKGKKYMHCGRVTYKEANGEAGPSRGNSGGPVYNTRGLVVCLHNGGPEGKLQLGGRSYGVAMHDILYDLKNEAMTCITEIETIKGVYVRDNEELLNGRYVYRGLTGVEGNESMYYFMATPDVDVPFKDLTKTKTGVDVLFVVKKAFRFNCI